MMVFVSSTAMLTFPCLFSSNCIKSNNHDVDRMVLLFLEPELGNQVGHLVARLGW